MEGGTTRMNPMTTKRSAAPSATPAPDSPETQTRPASTWTAAQRLALLTEYDSFPQGDPRRGELLRRHGLYTSHMSKWRDQRRRGTLTSQATPPTGRPPQPRDPQQDEIARLTQDVARLQAQLQQAETIMEIQKKVSSLLGVLTPTLPNGER
jgi:transposase